MFANHWRFRFGLLLFSISAGLLSVQAVLFNEGEAILRKVLYGLSFIPLQALVLTLVINGWLSSREKRLRIEKMNIAIGVFFNGMGRELLDRLIIFAALPGGLQQHLRIGESWTPKAFAESRATLRAAEIDLDMTRGDVEGLCSFLAERQHIVLDLLRNPSLLEHESFTDLLWAVSHVSEELLAREESGLPLKKDRSHLEEDLKRALRQLLQEWVTYMEHLQNAYPFLFSFALRSSPFSED